MSRKRLLPLLALSVLALSLCLAVHAQGNLGTASASFCQEPPSFLGNAITCLGDSMLRNVPHIEGKIEVVGKLTVPPGTTIVGDITCDELDNRGEIYGNVECRYLNNVGLIQGEVQACMWTLQSGSSIIPGPLPTMVCPGPDLSHLTDETGIWPKQEYLDAYYLEQVTDDPEDQSTYYPYTIIDSGRIVPMGDHYELVFADNYKGIYMGHTPTGAPRSLTFDMKGEDADKVIRLTKTVFVTGDLVIRGFTTLDLYGQTVYVQGDLVVGHHTEIMGSGAFIAIGPVNLQPNMAIGVEVGPILAMSVQSALYVGVNGLFKGSLASMGEASVQPGGALVGGIQLADLNYPPVQNTPVGTPITVTVDGVKITFNEVAMAGCTDHAVSQSNPYGSIPEGFRVHGQFIDINTSATYVGPITIGIPYNPSTPNSEKLKLFHWENGHWRDVTTWVDTTNCIVYGEVDSFSWFFLGGPEPQPVQPSNESPPDGAINLSLTPTLESSPFVGADPGDTHAASQWQITTTPGDYSTPVVGLVSSTYLTSFTVFEGYLDYGTTYYWHVRHRDNHGAWSAWSNETSFTTVAPVTSRPAQPVNISPEDKTTGVSLTPTLQASEFSDPDPGDTHAASHWQVRPSTGDYLNPAFQIISETDLTSVTIPSDTLGTSTTYYWHVRYQDSNGDWSQWSAQTSFTTLGPPVTPRTGCFIATAAYGSPMAEELDTFRAFRDTYLLTNPVGSRFVSLYYQYSPPVAEFIDKHPALKPVVRAALMPPLAMAYVAVDTTTAQKAAISGSIILIGIVSVLLILARRRGTAGSP